ncbi:MAG: branched-chain amino acid ABC transporter permease [Candidatus Geothermarchaeales archaeon]
MVVPFLLREAITYSSILSLLAIGLTLTFLTTRVPNFAHGTSATIGTYVTLVSVMVFSSSPYLLFPLSVVLGGVAALVLYKAFLKPLMNRGASIILLMIATVAYDMILVAVINIFADYLSTLQIRSRLFILRGFDFSVADLPGVFILSPLMAFGIIGGLHLALTRTKFGVAMRATIENESLAGVVGINTDLVYSVSWFLSGAVAGLAGGFLALFSIGRPDMGSIMLVSIFAASVTGGFFSIYGAVVGGFVIGLAEYMGLSYVAGQVGDWILPYRPVVPLLAMVIVLLASPHGLTGIRWSRLAKLMEVFGRGSTA